MSGVREKCAGPNNEYREHEGGGEQKVERGGGEAQKGSGLDKRG